jgi:hypothetical protein
MNKIVKILMERDGIDEEEARSLIKETRDEIMMLDNPLEADTVLMEYLGLEPDYMFDILNF